MFHVIKKGMSSQPHSTPLVVSNMFFSIIYGIIPTPLTHIFQDGEIAPPTRNFSSLWMKFCNFLLLWWRHGPHFRWNHAILGQHGTSCWKSWKTPCLAKILGELPSIQKVTSKFQNIFTEIPSVFSKFPVASEKKSWPGPGSATSSCPRGEVRGALLRYASSMRTWCAGTAGPSLMA